MAATESHVLFEERSREEIASPEPLRSLIFEYAVFLVVLLGILIFLLDYMIPRFA